MWLIKKVRWHKKTARLLLKVSCYCEDRSKLSFPIVCRKLPKVLQMLFERYRLLCYRLKHKISLSYLVQPALSKHLNTDLVDSTNQTDLIYYFQNSAGDILCYPRLWWISADYEANMWCWACVENSSQISRIPVCSPDRRLPYEERDSERRQRRLQRFVQPQYTMHRTVSCPHCLARYLWPTGEGKRLRRHAGGTSQSVEQ